MARINVDEEYWADPRRMRLAIKLGNEFMADGAMLNAWKLAERFWFERDGGEVQNKPIPLDAWTAAGLDDSIVEVGFAVKTDEGIYVKGTKERFAWRATRIENGKRGGRPKKPNGSEKEPNGLEMKPNGNHDQTIENHTKPSTSTSTSTSFSSSFPPTPQGVGLGRETKKASEVWLKTLNDWGLMRKITPNEETQIARAIAEHGLESVILALEGAAFEQPTNTYDPAKRPDVSRTLGMSGKRNSASTFQTLVDLGHMARNGTVEKPDRSKKSGRDWDELERRAAEA